MTKVAGLNWLIASLIKTLFQRHLTFTLLKSKEFVNDTCGWASICKRFEEL